MTSHSDPVIGRPDTASLLEDRGLVGVDLSVAWSAMIDDWIRQIYSDLEWGGRWGLAAVGGYGRADMSPGSDLDLVLFHDGSTSIDDLAKQLWYPLWDSGFKVGHAVRRPQEALALAADDLDTATALLDVRPLLGDTEFLDDIGDRAREQWRRRADDLLPRLVERTHQRHASMGEMAFLLEPDIKLAQGGLRDIHTLWWLDAARPTLAATERTDLADPHDLLLGVRCELHRLSGRSSDQLHLQEQDGVAAALGYDDADVLMAAIAQASRTVEWISGAALQRTSHPKARRRLLRPARHERVELGDGMYVQRGTLQLDTHAPVDTDPVLPLRVALTAAENAAFVDRDTLDRLAASPARLSDPWPDEAREMFVAILQTGRPAVAAIEALDQVDLVTRILPEWAPNRNRPQRNAYHRFTVDRHLLETAAEAAALTDRVERPDLLVLGALFHDIGKGYPGDHSEVGVDLVRAIATRMGFPPADVDVLADLVCHHLLLPDVASRRDLDDPGTTRFVASVVGSVGTLRLLGALTEADGLATGPSAWGSWKADLVNSLVSRTAMVLEGNVSEALTADFPNGRHIELLAADGQSIVLDGSELTLVLPNRPGLFSRVAGALALHGVKIIDAVLHTEGTMVLDVLRLRGLALDERPDEIVRDVELAVAGRLALQARLHQRARAYGTGPALTARPVATEVTCDNRFSETATVVDIRCPDSIGLLYRIARAMLELDVDIVSAKIQILGADIYGAFYVQGPDGEKIVDERHASELELAVTSAIEASSAASDGGRLELSAR